MRSFKFLPFFLLIILSACGSGDKTQVSTESLLGNWELVKEVANKKTLDCSADEVKSVLSFQENNYFVMYDDLKNSKLGQNVSKMQTQYTGQYELAENSFKMKYETEGNSFEDDFKVVKLSDKDLIILNKSSEREFHYSKR